MFQKPDLHRSQGGDKGIYTLKIGLHNWHRICC